MILTFFNVNVNEVKKVWQCYENSVAIMIFFVYYILENNFFLLLY